MTAGVRNCRCSVTHRPSGGRLPQPTQAGPQRQDLQLKESPAPGRAAALARLGLRKAHGHPAQGAPLIRALLPAPAKTVKRGEGRQIFREKDAQSNLLHELPAAEGSPSSLHQHQRPGHEQHKDGSAANPCRHDVWVEKYSRVASMSRPIWAVSSIIEGKVISSRQRSKNVSLTRSP